jgi:hypothetical protein
MNVYVYVRSTLPTNISTLLWLCCALLASLHTFQKLPGDNSNFTLFISALSGINFDVQLIKPGCIVGRMSFLTLFWSTIGVMFVASLLFTLAAYIRARLLLRKHLSALQQQQPQDAANDNDSKNTATTNTSNADDDRTHDSDAYERHHLEHSEDGSSVANRSESTAAYNFRSEFRNRWLSSQLILGCLIYLRLTSYILQGIHCVSVPDQQGNIVALLKADMVGIV